MAPFVRTCPRCRIEFESTPAEGGVLYDVCPRCEGVFVEASDRELVLGGPLPAPETLELPNPFGPSAGVGAQGIDLDCPSCLRNTLSDLAVGSLDRGIFACDSCGGVFFEMGAFIAIRRMIADGEPAPRISTYGLELAVPIAPTRPPPTSPTASTAIRAPRLEAPQPLTRAEAQALRGDDGTLTTARIPHDEPYSRLIVVPLCLASAYVLGLSSFGRLLGTPASIQFHELGHAIPAWLSGRLALPLPCGMTFWSASSSVLAHLLVLAGTGTLAYFGVREKRPFPIALAFAVALLHLTLGFVLAESRSVAIILASGCAGEIVLPTATLVAFFFRMPDRLRWDFFRFLVAPPAAIAFVEAFRLWIGVFTGTEAAPLGSILGTRGDGSGDLERLIHDHGVALTSLARGYAMLAFVALAVLVATYTFFAAAAVRELERRRARP